MNNELELKKHLYSECVRYVESKIEQIEKAVCDLQESANRETRSSMGDKYETTRASIHLEIEKYSQQLNEFTGLKKILFQINADKIYNEVQPGGVVFTSEGNYFIAINAGTFEFGDKQFMTISLASPLGKELHKRKAGDMFSFRNKNFEIAGVS